jgi:hypothetical protein
MRQPQSGVVRLVALLLFAAALILAATSEASWISRLSADSISIYGGDGPLVGCVPVQNNCIHAYTTCQDGTYDVCARVGTTNTCKQCKFYGGRTKFNNCVSSSDGTKACGTLIEPDAGQCGVYYYGTWDSTTNTCPSCPLGSSDYCGATLRFTCGVDC